MASLSFRDAVLTCFAVIAFCVGVYFISYFVELIGPRYDVTYRGQVVHRNARVSMTLGVLYVTDENGNKSAYASGWSYHQVPQDEK